MLPNEPDRSAAGGAPSEQPWAANPTTEPTMEPTPAPLTADMAQPAPPPTGLADEGAPDQPILTPVLPQQPERRRGWPFAISMVLVAVMAGGALFMSGYMVGRDQGRSPGGAASEADAWQPFWDVYDSITQRYPLETVERKTLIEGAIRGLVESVGDPYSSYLSPEDFRGTLDDISGTFEGIGAEIGAVDSAGRTADCATFGPDCHLVIIAPIEGSPAEAAGLKPGDIISTVDGSTLDGLTPDEARDRVRGKAGTEVKLHIQRFAAPVGAPATPAATAAPGASGAPAGSPAPAPSATPRQLLEEFDVTLVRAKVQRREVSSRELAGGTVGYVRLSGFSDAGADELETAIKAQLAKGIKKIVFDLRGNPGGFLTSAREVASEFIPDGTVFWEQDAKGGQFATDAEAGGVATDPSIKVVVLIDRGSASAAEIVAGALQDRGRAQLIGETSYGKGTVQEWIELGELGGVKLTVWKWLTPDKRWIHKTGLTPDFAVTVPADNPPGTDPVLDKALQVLGATGLGPAVLRAA
jgi:carboxyl-terminal processing protease